MATSTAKKRSKGTVVRDPRLSQRRAAVARSKTRRRLWIAGSIFVVLALVVGTWFLLHTSLFSAKTITVSGAVHESPAQVIAAAGLSAHPPLISINPADAETGIDQLGWVKSSHVSLHWPSTVNITVVERTPVASATSGSTMYLIDETGRILSISKTPVAGLVSLNVPDGTHFVVGTSLPLRVLPAASVAGSLPPAFKDQVAAVIAHPDGTVSLQLTSPITITLGTTAQLDAKYRDIASVIAGATLHPGDVVDVSVPQASTITGP